MADRREPDAVDGGEMLRRLRDMLGAHLQLAKRERAFRRWQLRHPDGSYGQFYADEARKRLSQFGRKGVIPLKTLGEHIDPAWARRRGESLLEYLKWTGCRPGHVVVDFGCGSLWNGEVVMSYLEPGRYVGMDVIDSFYVDAMKRLGPDFVADRLPVLEVISPGSLERARARNPDYVLSTAVLLHLPPSELADYFRQITSICGPSTRIIIGHKPHEWTRTRGSKNRLDHSKQSIRAALASLGYEPRFERPSEAPRCRIDLFEIARIRAEKSSGGSAT